MSTAVYAVHAAQWAARQPGAAAPRREFFSQLRRGSSPGGGGDDVTSHGLVLVSVEEHNGQ